MIENILTRPFYLNLDLSKESASRLQRLWEEEIENAEKNNRQPSFAKACAKFCRSRVIISAIFFSLLNLISISVIFFSLLNLISISVIFFPFTE